ncbi:MAG: M14 family zinc carboxypeptidase [Tepidisphaeraceae bacterium]
MPAAVIGKSVLGRPIEMYSFGNVEGGGQGGRPVLVMGAIHGDEPTSADVSRGLLAELQRDPSLVGGVPVVIIPVANPDGLAMKTHTNLRKVDLNRNFPARNWGEKARGRQIRGGTRAASELETQALIAIIERLQPRLIITVHSISDGKQCNNYDGPARSVAELMSRHNGYPAAATIGYPTPGSLGNWGGNDKQIPMITLELPRSLPASRAWPDNRAGVLAAIGAVK